MKQDLFVELYKHNFVMQLLQNPPLCISADDRVCLESKSLQVYTWRMGSLSVSLGCNCFDSSSFFVCLFVSSVGQFVFSVPFYPFSFLGDLISSDPEPIVSSLFFPSSQPRKNSPKPFLESSSSLLLQFDINTKLMSEQTLEIKSCGK